MRIAVILCLVLSFAVPDITRAQQRKNKSIVDRTTLEPVDDVTSSRTETIEKDIENLLSQMTLEEKVSLCHANGKFTLSGIERLGIQEMWFSDGPHGVREQISRDSWKPAGWTNDHATYLPNLTAVAASFNPDMATLHGSVLGAEARHRGKDVILGPGVNLARNPLYGRNFEYMGEDPYLASTIVVPEILAIQKNDVAACVKHYALNTQELNRHGVNAQPDERTLREIYLPAFEAAVKHGGVLTVMGAYNEFRGTNCNQSRHLVMDILKGQWGFKGLLMTDWDCDINTMDAAVNGLDIEMGTRKPSYDEYFLADPFLALLKAEKIPVEILDEKVRRILRVQLTIGMMDPNRKPGARGTDEHLSKARRILEEGVVLLKNDNQRLPLVQQQVKNVLVMGPNADTRHGHGGGSSQVKSLFEVTPLEGLQKKLGANVQITHLKAAPPETEGLRPISPDFVITKSSGAGTPAWKNLSFADAKKKEKLGFAWKPNSRIRFEDGKTHHEHLIAELEPLESGTHMFQVEADGRFELVVNNQSVLKNSDASLDATETAAMELEKGNRYNVRLSYDGEQGCTLGWIAPGDLFVNQDVYVAAAQKADVVFYFAGLNHMYDRESEDRADMKLPGNQDQVIASLLRANPNTIVFMIAGSAVEMPWVDQVEALVWGWYGGMLAGEVYVDVAFGDVVPSGKMPITLSQKLADNPHVRLNDYNAEDCFYREGVFMGYRWFEKEQIEPCFPFGHGLSYTTFEYSDIKLSADSIGHDETLRVTFNITNTGEVKGAEAAQLYVEDLESSVPRAKKELKGFHKVLLGPGETKQVTLSLSDRAFAFWDEESNDWKIEPGQFKIHVGSSVSEIKLQATFDVR